MKILHISFFSKKSPASGGKICSMRNLEALKHTYGDANVVSYCIEREPNKGSKMLWNLKQFMTDIINRRMNGLSDDHTKNIMKIVKDEEIETVFLDSSLLGQLAQVIKGYDSNIKVITFFHNVEWEFCKQLWKKDRTLRNIYRPYVAKYNEKKACSWSDITIALNKRDAQRLHDLYQIDINALIPISIEDQYRDYKGHKVTTPMNLLFIGSYFYANVEAVNYIVNMILPYVDARLTVVGSGMERLGIVDKKVKIYANVDDIVPFFQEADAMILPIFSGSGMKIKTCESMMHGKVMFGTDEAFEGYITSPTFAIKCNTDKEFINSINRYQSDSNYSKESRNNFLLHYSNISAYKLFEKIL